MMHRLCLLLMLTPIFANAQNRPTLPAVLTVRQALDIALVNSSTLREARANLGLTWNKPRGNTGRPVRHYCLRSA